MRRLGGAAPDPAHHGAGPRPRHPLVDVVEADGVGDQLGPHLAEPGVGQQPFDARVAVERALLRGRGVLPTRELLVHVVERLPGPEPGLEGRHSHPPAVTKQGSPVREGGHRVGQEEHDERGGHHVVRRRGRPRVGGVAQGDVHLRQVCSVRGEVLDHPGRHVDRVDPPARTDGCGEGEGRGTASGAEVQGPLAGTHVETFDESLRDHGVVGDARLVVGARQSVEHRGDARDGLVHLRGHVAIVRRPDACCPRGAPRLPRRVRRIG